MPKKPYRIPFMVGVIAIALSSAALAQSGIRNVNVNRLSMRIRSARLEQRKPGQPIIVLESGSGSGLDDWAPVFAQLSQLAPVLAYDRSGLGRSEFDGERPTLPHVAQTLHALLIAAHAPGPYVLVGHSWGGEYIRGFVSLYPDDVAGLVYLDATDFERTEEEVNRERPAGSQRTGTGDAPPIPANPPAERMEMEQIIEYGKAGFAEIRALKVPPELPIAVLIGASPKINPSNPDLALFKRLQVRHQGNWTLASPNGLLLVSTQSGHQVMKDAPSLVVQAVAHVVNAGQVRKQ